MRIEDEIASYLVGTGRPLTVEEIARGINRRTANVRRALQTDERFVLWPSRTRRLWAIIHVGEGSPSVRDGSGRGVAER